MQNALRATERETTLRNKKAIKLSRIAASPNDLKPKSRALTTPGTSNGRQVLYYLRQEDPSLTWLSGDFVSLTLHKENWPEEALYEIWFKVAAATSSSECGTKAYFPTENINELQKASNKTS